MPIEKIGNYRWSVVALLFFATTINYIDRQILGLLKPFISDDLHISESDYGYIVSAFQAAYAFGLLFVGRLVDRFGTKIAYSVAIVVWSVAGCFHAAARSAFGFGLARVFLGLGESANFPSAIKATAEWFPKKERALATGIFNSGCNIGAVVAPLIVTYVTVKFGWQWAFITTGSLGFLWLLFWLFFYKLPQHSEKLSPSELVYIQDDEALEEVVSKVKWWSLLRNKSAQGICLARFVCDWVWWFFLFWTPDYLQKSQGVNILQMVLPLIIIYTFAAFGGVTGGAISSVLVKKGRSVSFSRKAAMLTCALLVVPVVLLPIFDSLWVAVALISLATFAHQGWASNVFTLVSDYFPKQMIGTMTSLAGFCGSVGGVLAAAFVGNVLEITHSYFLVFLLAGSSYLIAWLFLQLFLPKETVTAT